MLRIFLLPLFLFCTLLQAQSNSVLDSLLQKNPQFLPVEQAFQFDFSQQQQQLTISWQIADGYYLYRDKIKLGGIAVSFSHPIYPDSIEIEDEFFGKTEVYFNQLSLTIPLSDIGENAVLKVQYMGCAEAGFCYPPATQEIPLQTLAQQDNNTPTSSQYNLADKLASGATIATLAGFFLLGIGLAFTPCVFPMYPILTSIIVGQGSQLSGKRAFALSFSYVQGMALTYSALGLVVASMGVKFQAYMQHPAILITASIIFILLAIAMFGGFNLALPARWQEKVSAISNKQKGGSAKGAFIMGALSGLIASPCTTAPLSAALLYVAQSGDLFVGALTLYILSLGMGLPLLLLGSSGGRLLPKAGNWMNAVKTVFGFLLLAVPLMLLERLLPWPLILTAASILSVIFIVYLWTLIFQFKQLVARALLAVSAQILLIMTIWVNIHYWLPTSTVQQLQPNAQGFIEVSSLEQLQQQLNLAGQKQQYTMVDLYADWCVACKEFEHLTFPKPEVQAQLQKMQLIKIDVTNMTETDDVLLQHFDVMGLPTLLFFAPDGKELTTSRVTGFMAAAPFAAHLQQLTGQP